VRRRRRRLPPLAAECFSRVARSGALLGNAPSLGVSRKLGYTEVGISSASPRGTPVPHHDLELARAQFTPAADVRIEGLEPVRRYFTDGA